MKKSLKIISGLGIILVGAFLFVPLVMWDGSVPRSIKVTVKSYKGRLIKGASVSLIQHKDELIKDQLSLEEFESRLLKERRKFVSDENGSGMIYGRFPAGGSNSLIRKTGSFTVYGNLVVSHNDYNEISVPLANFLGDLRIPISKDNFEIIVFMNPRISDIIHESEQAAPSNP